MAGPHSPIRVTALAAVLLGGCGSLVIGVDTDKSSDDATDTDVVDTDSDGVPDDTDDTDVDTLPTDTDDGPGPSGGTPNLMIVEVADGTAAPNLRYIELYNPLTTALSLDGWRINHIPNGVGADIETLTLPAVNVPARGSFVVAYDAGRTAFENNFAPADLYSDVIAGDGNDAYLLKEGSRLVDIYGKLNEDGSGTAWDYTDAVAKRKVSVGGPGITWSAAEWTITSGQDAMNPGDRR